MRWVIHWLFIISVTDKNKSMSSLLVKSESGIKFSLIVLHISSFCANISICSNAWVFGVAQIHRLPFLTVRTSAIPKIPREIKSRCCSSTKTSNIGLAALKESILKQWDYIPLHTILVV